jgi:hypothetical protein
MIKPADRRAVLDWDEFFENQNRDAAVDLNETPLQKKARMSRLEGDDEEWMAWYFSKFYTSSPARFHIESTKRVMNNAEWFEARPWSRELSKTGRTMMESLKLSLTRKKRNWLLISNSNENAVRILKPYRSALEKNNRIINDYGVQRGHRNWTESEFISRMGFAYRALGWQESPRGTRMDEVRPDGIIFDDFDTDAECRNPDIVDQKWDWVERAAIGTRSISNPLLVIFNGNIIAENCCMLRAMKAADYSKIVNIRDENGKSTWPQKNTEELIDIALRNLSYRAIQGEYYNNPITEGKVFKQLNYKKIRPLKDYQFLVAYCDPSYKKKGDYKALVLAGKYKDEYHIIKVYCAQATTSDMMDWHYEIMKMVGGVVPVHYLIEWPWIDDTLKLEIAAANIKHKVTLPIKADERDKPDKYHRIESLLEPLNRNEKLWFNEQLKDSQHMQAMEAQFLALSPTSRAHDDGPDAVEGAIWIVNSKTIADISKIKYYRPTQNAKRY